LQVVDVKLGCEIVPDRQLNAGSKIRFGGTGAIFKQNLAKFSPVISFAIIKTSSWEKGLGGLAIF
jgi:hypothetical protein